MVGHALDRGDLKNSESVLNYFFPKSTGLGFDILVLIRICPQLVQVIRIGFINEISSSTTSFKYAQKFIHNQEKAPTESNLTRPGCEVVIWGPVESPLDPFSVVGSFEGERSTPGFIAHSKLRPFGPLPKAKSVTGSSKLSKNTFFKNWSSLGRFLLFAASWRSFIFTVKIF